MGAQGMCASPAPVVWPAEDACPAIGTGSPWVPRNTSQAAFVVTRAAAAAEMEDVKAAWPSMTHL